MCPVEHSSGARPHERERAARRGSGDIVERELRERLDQHRVDHLHHGRQPRQRFDSARPDGRRRPHRQRGQYGAERPEAHVKTVKTVKTKTARESSKTASKPSKKTAHKASHRSAPTTLLEKQHRKVEGIFKKLEGGRSDMAPLLTELANNLAAHMAIEQEIYYPAVKKVDADLVLESYEEHSLAELGLKRLLATPPKHEAFKARVTAVKELIQHHVEEEEGDLFPHVDKKLDKGVLVKLGDRMAERFAEVLEAGFRAAVPNTYEETSADVSKQ
jgi:iron-sulfur cluster repair protein YtfE (RIC family)